MPQIILPTLILLLLIEKEIIHRFIRFSIEMQKQQTEFRFVGDFKKPKYLPKVIIKSVNFKTKLQN